MNTFISLAAVILCLVLNTAHADEAPKSLRVQFADLDLSREAGAAALFNRLKGAARAVCSAHSGGTTLRDKQQHAACLEFALSNAVARVDRPELTEYVTRRPRSQAVTETSSARCDVGLTAQCGGCENASAALRSSPRRSPVFTNGAAERRE